MKLTELLISIAIFTIVVGTTVNAYTSFIKNSNRLEIETRNADKVLVTDFKIRKEIKDIKIPYWKNVNTEFIKYITQLKQTNYNDSISIINVEPLKNSKGIVKGLIVTWNYQDKTYKIGRAHV